MQISKANKKLPRTYVRSKTKHKSVERNVSPKKNNKTCQYQKQTEKVPRTNVRSTQPNESKMSKRKEELTKHSIA